MIKQLTAGGGPQLDRRGQAHVTENGHPHPSWEVLPPEETRVDKSALEHEKALAILKAHIGGATKKEIARVFGIKEKIVRSIIEAARRTAADYSYVVSQPAGHQPSPPTKEVLAIK